MSRTLAISDIHGCYDTFVRLLKRVSYQPGQDTLILLGDYVDRGHSSKEVMELIMEMVSYPRVIALRGNHDHRFWELMTGADFSVKDRFIHHGGWETMKSYCGLETNAIFDEDSFASCREAICSRFQNHLTFISKLPLYHEDDAHIYVHAGLNPSYRDWKEQPERDFMWIREPFIHHKTEVSKKVVFGHSRTVDIHGSGDVWFGDDKIGIDGACSYGYQLNCLEIIDESYYVYSEPFDH